MYSIKDISEIFEKFAPKINALEWDNTGILINCKNTGERILLAIDLTDSVVDEAIEGRYNFIIAYHPIIYDPLKTIVDERYIKLIKNNISVFCPHTQLDNLMNSYILDTYKRYSFNEVKSILKLERKHIIYVQGNPKNDIPMDSRLHVGVGSTFKNCTITNSYIITGEINHHEMINMKRNKNSVLILGHWNSEAYFLTRLKTMLSSYTKNPTIIDISKNDCCPYEVL